MSKKVKGPPPPPPAPKDPPIPPLPAPNPGPFVLGQARGADAFVDSIGVNTHIRWATYDPVYDSIIKPRLLESGIRHIRDNSSLGMAHEDRYRELATHGIRSCFTTNPQNCTPANYIEWAIDGIGVATFDGVEGMNEPDGPGGNWSTTAVNWQRALYTAFKANHKTAGIPFLNMSIYKAGSAAMIQGAKGFFDINHIHPYPGGIEPELVNGALDWHVTNIAKAVDPSKPIMATETGYHNALINNPHRAASESAASVYMPRIFMHYFNKGIVRAYPYEFYDEGTDANNREHHFGLLRHDGSLKPAFAAIKNLISLLNDTGPPFALGSLSYQISVANAQTTLLQKRDGVFYLAFWQPAHIWDQISYKPIAYTQKTATIAFGVAPLSVQSVVPNEGVAWTDVPVNSRAVNVPLRDVVTLLKIVV